MSGFTAEWLALRERYDLAARNPSVLGAVMSSLKSVGSVHVVDLACGSGSTFRALRAHLPPRQHWELVDNDPEVLALRRAGRLRLRRRWSLLKRRCHWWKLSDLRRSGCGQGDQQSDAETPVSCTH